MEKNIENEIEEPFKKHLDDIGSLLNKAEEYQQLINDYDNIGNLEFYRRLKKLDIDTSLDDSEYIKIIELINQKKYKGPVVINTNMKVKTREEKGRGKDRESYVVVRPVKLEVIYTDELDLDHKYDVNEIANLGFEGKLIVLRRVIMWEKDYNDYGEYCPSYNTSSIDNSIFYQYRESGERFSHTLRYMREKYDKKKLDSLFKDLIALTRIEMNLMSTMQSQYEEKGFQKRIDKLTNK